jgi:hypothetical protein
MNSILLIGALLGVNSLPIVEFTNNMPNICNYLMKASSKSTWNCPIINPFESSAKTPCIQQVNFIEKFNGKFQSY